MRRYENHRSMGTVGEQELVLGTNSLHRRAVFERSDIAAEWRWRCLAADIDEKKIRHRSPAVMVEMIARAKSEAIASMLEEPSFLITTDEVVVFDGEVREKPENARQAAEWIAGYRGRTLTCVTALHVLDTGTGRSRSDVAFVDVSFLDRGFTGEEVAATVARGSVLSTCGAYLRSDATYASQTAVLQGFDGRGGRLPLDEMEHAILGLPLRMLGKFLQELGGALL